MLASFNQRTLRESYLYMSTLLLPVVMSIKATPRPVSDQKITEDPTTSDYRTPWAQKTIRRLRPSLGSSLSLQANTRTPLRIPTAYLHESWLTDNNRPRANLTILGAFTGLFCTVGFLNSFGVFEAYYMQYQLADETETTIAWIGALSIFFIFSISVISGPLLDFFGPGVSLIHEHLREKERWLTGTVDAVCGLLRNGLCHDDGLFMQGVVAVYSRSGYPTWHLDGFPGHSHACPCWPAYQG